MTRFSISLAAAVGLTTLVSAEPIRWTYTGKFSGDQGSAFVADGQGGRPDSSEPDGFRRYQGYTDLTTAANLGPQAGSMQFVLGTVGRGGFYWLADTGPKPVLNDFFLTKLTIRDGVSGASGVVSVTGTAQSNDSWLGLPADTNLPDVSQLLGYSSQDLTLGGNVYRVKFAERKVNPRSNGNLGADWDSLEVIADVQVGPASQTPEPGTLALAGLGLAGLVGMRMQRK